MADNSEEKTAETRTTRKIHLFGKQFEMPQSRTMRIAIGVLFILFGLLGFLPVLGFWMIPLGLLVLSYEFAVIRRLRRKAVVRFSRRQKSD